MMWLNLAGLFVGWLIFRDWIAGSQYMQVVMGGLGAIGSIANLVFSIAMQIRGYADEKILDVTYDVDNR